VSHRYRLVQIRTRVKNQLRAIALNEGMGRPRARLQAVSSRERESGSSCRVSPV